MAKLVKTKQVVYFYDLPEQIQTDLKLVREWKCNESYSEVDVMSDEDKDEWIKMAPPDEYTKADCRISDCLKSQGAKVGSVVVLRSW